MSNTKITVHENIPKELQLEVAARIEASQKKYAILRTKQQKEKEQRKAAKQAKHKNNLAFRAIIKEGNEFWKENKESIVSAKTSIKGFNIYYAIKEVKGPTTNGKINLRYSIAIKAPTDKHREEIATGLCGYRLKEETKYTGHVEVEEILWLIEPDMIIEAIEHTIKAKILLLAAPIPQRLKKVLIPKLEQKNKNKEEIIRKCKIAQDAIAKKDIDTFESSIKSLQKLCYLSKQQINKSDKKLKILRAEFNK